MRVAAAGVCALLLASVCTIAAADSKASPNAGPTLAQFVIALQGKAKVLESSSGMREGYRSFSAAYRLSPNSLPYSDYVMARLLFEATRDAGFWNLHWTITDRQPVSDNIWRQWRDLQKVSALRPTADAECDELSALYAFLMTRAGVHGVGLFWPYPNHTVSAWVLHTEGGSEVRVVVPTTQIFLSETDFFGTRKFNSWRQKRIFEYTRRDIPDSFVLSPPVVAFFLHQVDKYGGASNTTLQKLRYLREGVFLRYWSPEEAARVALEIRAMKAGPTEDSAALWNFAEDMRAEPAP